MGSDIRKQKENDLDIYAIKKKLIVVEAQKQYLFDKMKDDPDSVSFQLSIVLETEIELKQSLNDLDLLKFCDRTDNKNIITSERTELMYKYINKHMKSGYSSLKEDNLAERFDKLGDDVNYDLLIPKAPLSKVHP